MFLLFAEAEGATLICNGKIENTKMKVRLGEGAATSTRAGWATQTKSWCAVGWQPNLGATGYD
jgi:hypothetical protein